MSWQSAPKRTIYLAQCLSVTFPGMRGFLLDFYRHSESLEGAPAHTAAGSALLLAWISKVTT